VENLGRVSKLNDDKPFKFTKQILLLTRAQELNGGKKSVDRSKDILQLRT
jgi:hypothetical protein